MREGARSGGRGGGGVGGVGAVQVALIGAGLRLIFSALIDS